MSKLIHRDFAENLITGCALFVLSIMALSGNAQTKEFYTVDRSSKEPISYVSIFCPKTLSGSISNADGKVKLEVSPTDTVVFSCLGYQKKKIVFNNLGDTVYLKPITYTLKNVIVYGFALKRMVLWVVKNYFNLYVKDPRIYECTYKESFKVDDSLKRLTQVQIRWWDKSYKFNFKKPIQKKEEVSITNVDYSKEVLNTLESNANVNNEQFFEYLHLNHYLDWILRYAKDIVIRSVKEQKNYTKVLFTAAIVVKGDTVARIKKAFIYFDDKTGAILEFSYNTLYYNQIRKNISSQGILYESSVHKENTTILFSELPSHKLAISFYRTNLSGVFKVFHQIKKFSVTKKLFVTKVEKGKKIPWHQRIDLRGLLFENFPLHKRLTVKIPLTKEESEFINK